MKTIKLPTTEVHKPLDVLRTVVDTPQQGVLFSEIEQRLSLLAKMREAEGKETLELEDAEYGQLRGLYESFRFGAVHMDLKLIGDAIKAAA